MQPISNASMHIVMVQKIKLNGERCAQSARVFQDLKKRNLLDRIHQVAIADERDPTSIGYKLAAQHQVDKAPFFVVTLGNNGSPQVYRAYQHFLKEVFHQVVDEAVELAEMIAQNPDLDFI